ncbi:unnamed protein product [Closterium sp. NIES-53]
MFVSVLQLFTPCHPCSGLCHVFATTSVPTSRNHFCSRHNRTLRCIRSVSTGATTLRVRLGRGASFSSSSQRGQLCLAYVASQANTADVFTKALQPCDHQPCFAFLDWSCDLLFSPTWPMGLALLCLTGLVTSWLSATTHVTAGRIAPAYGYFKFSPDRITVTLLQGRRDLIIWRESIESQLEVVALKGFANGTVPIPPEEDVKLHGEFRAAHLLTFLFISSCCSPVVQLALRSCRERLDAGHQAWHFILSTYQVKEDLYIGQLEEKMTHIRMGEQESATDYYNHARRICQVAASCSCCLLSQSLPPLPPSPAPPCLPCVEGRQRAAPHSSFSPTTAPLQTLHMDVWGPARVSGQSRKSYFLLVVDDYTRYTTVFPLRSKGQVVDVLIPWIRTVCLQLRERFGQDLPVLRLHSDRGGEFSSNLLRDFCHGEGILQLFTLSDSPQENGIAGHRIGLVMEVARTSMIHAAAPHFLWPFAVRYAAHQLNLWPRVSLPETSPSLRWTGEVGDASLFRVCGSRAFVRDTSADKLSPRAIPCVFLGFVPDARGWQFYHPTLRRVFPSQDVTFDEAVEDMGPMLVEVLVTSVMEVIVVEVVVEVVEVERSLSEPFRGRLGGLLLGVVSLGVLSLRVLSLGVLRRRVRSLEVRSLRVLLRLEVLLVLCRDCLWRAGGAGVAAGAGVTEGTATTGPGGARTRGTGADGTGGVEGAGAGDPTESGATGASGSGAGGAGAGGAGVGGPGVGGARAGGAGVVDSGGAVRPRPYFVPLLQQVLDAAAVTAGLSTACSFFLQQSGGLTEPREPASRPVSPVRTARRVPCSRPPPVLGTHAMTLRPSSVPLRVPLPAPLESSLPEVPDPESNRARAASPTVSRLLATAITDPLFESAAASALDAELLDFAAACRLDYTTALVAESASASPPSVGGECALSTDVLEDRQEDFECLAAAVPRFTFMLLAPEGDPDALDIPTPRSYTEAITGPYSSQW